MPLKERMDDYDLEVSVIDVYDIASEIGKEFEKIIDCFGTETVTGLMPKVITALEHLEVLASKNERVNSNVQELEAKIQKLERDKLEKAEDRIRYERDLELIEDHWRKETKDLESVVSTLQDENRKLKNALSAKQDIPAQSMAPEVDIAALQRLRSVVDQLRDNLRKTERDLSEKNSNIDDLSNKVKRLTNINKEISRKTRLMHFQVSGLIDERAELCGQVSDLNNQISTLREHLGEAVKENGNSSKAQKDFMPEMMLSGKEPHKVDANQPRFTTAELKDILHERNSLKARISDLEEELDRFRPKPEEESPVEEDSTVQGPLPYEPDDAPWKKSGNDSGIRKFFRKLFSESNMTFLGSSPKRSLSSLSKITLAGGTPVNVSL